MPTSAVRPVHSEALRRIVFVRNTPLAADVEATLRDDSMVFEYVERLEEVDRAAAIDAVVFASSNDADTVISAAQRLRQANPQCLRIHVHRDDCALPARIYDTVHQVMPRSRALNSLAATLARCFELRDTLARAHQDETMSGLESLPSLPHVYHEFVRASQSESVDFAELADIVESDLALAARILGLANSASFGLPSSVTTITQAVSVIGIEMLSALVTATSLFGVLADGSAARRMEGLWMHASDVSRLAVRMAAVEARLSREQRAEISLAGLLHDIGQLVIMTRMPECHAEIEDGVRASGEPAWVVEKRILGTSHADIGACLLAYWGLDTRIIEAVAMHHDLERAAKHADPSVWAICAANTMLLDAGHMTASYRIEQAEDQSQLETHFGADRVSRWRFELAAYMES